MMRVDYLTNENWELCEAHIVNVGDTHEVDVDIEEIITHIDYAGAETHAYKWGMCISTDEEQLCRWATQQEHESATDTFETLYKRMCAEMGITPLWKRV